MWRLGPVVGCKIPKFGFPHRNSKIERKNHASIFFFFSAKVHNHCDFTSRQDSPNSISDRSDRVRS